MVRKNSNLSGKWLLEVEDVEIRRFIVRAPVYQEADEVVIEIEEVEISRSGSGSMRRSGNGYR